jgi:hypothetical protein
MWTVEFDDYVIEVYGPFFCVEYFTILGASGATYQEV